MARHNQLGKAGEDEACRYLEAKGFHILVRNWRFGHHEIDIIAQDEECIIFVEVKTRSTDQWGHPEDFVSKAQMKRIVEAADFYIKEYDIEKEPRFDVVAIVNKFGTIEIEHFDDAFYPSVN